MTELTIQLDSRDEAMLLFGSRDAFLREIRTTLGAQVVGRGDQILIKGTDEQTALARRIFDELRRVLRQQSNLTIEDVKTVLEVVLQGGERLNGDKPTETPTPSIGGSSKYLRPRTDGQGRYVKAMKENDLTVCIGPAGTGKTFLAVGMAVSLLRQSQVKKIVLVRPAVEAGERLGYLPGDMIAKINPYLRPLFDALNDMMEGEQVKRYMDNDIIEVAPLAFMRGRAQPLATPVATPFGWKAIGSLQVGDYVIGSDGRPTQVLGVFPQGRKEVFRVSMSDRTATRCCGEHLWTVYTPEDRTRTGKPRVLETRQMIGTERRNHQHRYELPLVAPVQFPAQEVPLDPYALGLLLGDGCMTGSTTPSFSTADQELVLALGTRLPETTVTHRGGVDYTLNRVGRPRGRRPNPVSTILRDLHLWGMRSSTKFIPKQYLWNSMEVRHALLQGLLDTDGGPVTQAGRTCRVQFTTTSPRLRDDVLFLVQSLGGVVYWRTRVAEGRSSHKLRDHEITYRSDAYVMDLRLPEMLAPFRLQRKAAVYAEHGSGRPMRFISRIEPDGVEECVCIRVAASDSLYATESFILTHNTLNNAVILLDEAQNTTIAQMKMFLTRMGTGSKIIATGDVTQIDLPPHTRSGLVDAVQRLKKVEGVAIVQLDEHDIVRNPLVQRVLKAYDEDKPSRKRSN
jgi:phosphate starvation-inducible PhoH-like protein